MKMNVVGELRVAYNKNPKWYSELCKMKPKPIYREDSKSGKLYKRKNRKKPQTNLKRRDIINVMKSMIKYKKSKSKYADYILDIAKYRSEILEELCPF